MEQVLNSYRRICSSIVFMKKVSNYRQTVGCVHKIYNTDFV